MSAEGNADGSGSVIRIMHGIAGLALVVMMLVVVGDVLLRAVFNVPIKGAYDIVSMALLVMSTFGMAPVVARRGEILVDLVDGLLPSVAIRMLVLCSAMIGLLLFLFFGWAMLAPALDAWRWGERSLELGIPKWPLWVVAFVALVGILWAYALRLWAWCRGDAQSSSVEEGL